MTSAVRYTRPVPEGWTDLTIYTESIIPDDIPPAEHIKRHSLRRLFKQTHELSTEDLEANYYYALGRIMCGMQSILQDPRERETVVRVAAEGMVTMALLRRADTVPLDRPFVPLVGDLLPQAMEWPFYALAKASVSSMLAPRRVLADVLTAAVAYRRHDAEGTLRRPRLLAHAALIELCRDQQPAVCQVGCNSLESATSVLGVLLTGTNPKAGFTKQALETPIDVAAVDHYKRSKTFINAGRLRLDELRRGVGWEGQGASLRFNTDVLASPPLPLDIPSRPGHLHERRLTCPAIQAGGLAHDVVRDIMPAVITTAQSIVPGALRTATGLHDYRMVNRYMVQSQVR